VRGPVQPLGILFDQRRAFLQVVAHDGEDRSQRGQPQFAAEIDIIQPAPHCRQTTRRQTAGLQMQAGVATQAFEQTSAARTSALDGLTRTDMKPLSGVGVAVALTQ
jgi:hypothetical protein